MDNRIKHEVQVGQHFGDQTVLEVGLRIPRTDRKTPDRAVRVVCKCGRIRVVRISALFGTRWQTKTCRFCRAAEVGFENRTWTPEVAGILARLRSRTHGRGYPINLAELAAEVEEVRAS